MATNVPGMPDAAGSPPCPTLHSPRDFVAETAEKHSGKGFLAAGACKFIRDWVRSGIQATDRPQLHPGRPPDESLSGAEAGTDD